MKTPLSLFVLALIVPSLTLLGCETKSSSLTKNETNDLNGLEIMESTPLQEWLAPLEAYKAIWRVWPEKDQKDFIGLNNEEEVENPAEWNKELNKAQWDAIAERYGYIVDPEEETNLPVGLLEKDGFVYTNCLMCHSRRIENTLVMGGKNQNIDFNSLIEDLINSNRVFNGKDENAIPLTQAQLEGAVLFNRSVGTFNTIASLYSWARYRDEDFNLIPNETEEGVEPRKDPKIPNADSVVLPWWNTKHKEKLFWDGWLSTDASLHSAAFRMLWVQPDPINGLPARSTAGKIIREEKEVLHKLHDYTLSVESPKIEDVLGVELDPGLVVQGEQVYKEQNCASCHGTYTADGQPERKKWSYLLAQETEEVRFNAVTKEYIGFYNEWMSGTDAAGNKQELATPVDKRGGYLAPPLTGVWANAPYLHNGSVPTLTDLLSLPSMRPTRWRITDRYGHDVEKGGVPYERVSNSDTSGLTNWQKQQVFDATRTDWGKGNQGHAVCEECSEEDIQALVMYLQSL